MTLRDGREFEAKVVGTDPKSDLAAIRLKGSLRSHPAELRRLVVSCVSASRPGHRQSLRHWPDGDHGHRVGATGRADMGIVDYEDFIQTDAAINPGNSGGALVNMRGELVGINTAIFSRTGGYQGVGFAIPSDMIHPILDSLVKDGKVSRGFLGIGIQTVDSDLAQALNLGTKRGVLVSQVQDGSPAKAAGLQRGDVITAVNDNKVKDSSQLRNRIASHRPGSKVTLTVLRGKEIRTLTATLKDLAGSTADAGSPVEPKAESLSGISVSGISPQMRSQYDLPATLKGVIVTDVDPSSRAARAGLRPGDVILEVNRNKVDSASAFAKASKKAGNVMALLVYRDDSTVYLAIRNK